MYTSTGMVYYFFRSHVTKLLSVLLNKNITFILPYLLISARIFQILKMIPCAVHVEIFCNKHKYSTLKRYQCSYYIFYYECVHHVTSILGSDMFSLLIFVSVFCTNVWDEAEKRMSIEPITSISCFM